MAHKEFQLDRHTENPLELTLKQSTSFAVLFALGYDVEVFSVEIAVIKNNKLIDKLAKITDPVNGEVLDVISNTDVVSFLERQIVTYNEVASPLKVRAVDELPMLVPGMSLEIENQ